MNLSDAFLEIKDYNHAMPHYLEALNDSSQNDFYLSSELVEVYFLAEDYNSATFYADKIKHRLEFKKSRTQFIYGLTQEKRGDFEDAEFNLRQIDVRYSFYEERLILAKFLLSLEKIEDAKAILEEVQIESQHMTKTNSRIYRNTILEVEKVLETLS